MFALNYPSYTHNTPIISPRDRYLSALAQAKAAEEEFLASEAIRREELALRRRLQEIQIQLQRQRAVTRDPISELLHQIEEEHVAQTHALKLRECRRQHIDHARERQRAVAVAVARAQAVQRAEVERQEFSRARLAMVQQHRQAHMKNARLAPTTTRSPPAPRQEIEDIILRALISSFGRPAPSTQTQTAPVTLSSSSHASTSSLKGKGEASSAPMPEPTEERPSSRDVLLSMQTIQSIETAFHTLKEDFTFPSQLDFSPHSPSTSNAPLPSDSQSLPSDSDSLPSGDQPQPQPQSESPMSTLAYTPRNAPLRSYEQALTGLLTRLDAVESYGNVEVRVGRKEVVRLVEAELADMEREVRGRWGLKDRDGKLGTVFSVPIVDAVSKADMTSATVNDLPSTSTSSSPSEEEIPVEQLKSNAAEQVMDIADSELQEPVATTSEGHGAPFQRYDVTLDVEEVGTQIDSFLLAEARTVTDRDLAAASKKPSARADEDDWLEVEKA